MLAEPAPAVCFHEHLHLFACPDANGICSNSWSRPVCNVWDDAPVFLRNPGIVSALRADARQGNADRPIKAARAFLPSETLQLIFREQFHRPEIASQFLVTPILLQMGIPFTPPATPECPPSRNLDQRILLDAASAGF